MTWVLSGNGDERFQSSFNTNLSCWDVSKVTDMYGMFYNARAFNNNISSWDVSSVTTMGYMFAYASSFGMKLCNWSLLNPSVNVTDMFAGSNCSIECFDCPAGSPTANPTGSKTSKPTAKPTDDPTGSPRDRSFVKKLISKHTQPLQSVNSDLEEAVGNLQAKHVGLEA